MFFFLRPWFRPHSGVGSPVRWLQGRGRLVSAPVSMIPLASFNQGSAEYPDRSTTVILTGQDFGSHPAVSFSGPGIKDTVSFGTGPVPPVFWDQVIANNRQFPRGIDLVFAGEDVLSALPRSTRILKAEV